MNVLLRASAVLILTIVAAPAFITAGENLLLADGKAWPGQILLAHDNVLDTILVRPQGLTDNDVPRVQSLTTLADGRLIFCSGLDRSVFELTPAGERRLHYGGGLARQVRTASDGMLYWSGLETPLDGNPLPDGFIFSWNPATNETRTVLTFSQGDVGRDWWGAFDVRGDRILVGTLRGNTTIYDVSVSPVERVVTLPIAATAFRFAADGSLYAADGRGALYRFANLAEPEHYELVFRSPVPFVDFAFAPPGSAGRGF